MKLFKSTIIALTFLFTFSQANAKGDPTATSMQDLQYQVSSIIQNNEALQNLDHSYLVTVTFKINDAGEVIVLKTDHDEIDQILKNVLNYQRIYVDPSFLNETFIITEKIQMK